MTPSRLAAILVVLTFVLIFMGGQVTTTASGDSVPPWPASFFIPQDMPQVWELGHRWVAGTVGVIALILAAWVLARVSRVTPRRLVVAAAILVVVQALVGGLRVLSKEKHVRAVIHALLAQAFLACVVALASSLRAGAGAAASGPAVPSPADASVRGRAFALAVMTWIQVGLGAVLRHETLDKNPWGLALHLAGAFLVIVFVVRLLVITNVHPRFRAFGHLMAGVLLLQLVLGFTAWTTTHTSAGYVNPDPKDVRSLIPTAHVVLGAGILALSVALGMRESGRSAGGVSEANPPASWSASGAGDPR